MQEEAWTEYLRIVKKWYKPDVLLVNGDAIEGRQSRQGSSELITANLEEQARMATICINQFRAKRIMMTYGTSYHTSPEAEDWEHIIAQDLKADISGHLFFELEGLTFDCRHKTNSSGVPHGRATPLLKDMVWNNIKSETTEPLANVIIRSHVHYFMLCETPECCVLSTPSLQLSRGRYGSREMSGETHWGAIRLLINKGKIVQRDIDICKLHANSHKVIKIK